MRWMTKVGTVSLVCLLGLVSPLLGQDPVIVPPPDMQGPIIMAEPEPAGAFPFWPVPGYFFQEEEMELWSGGVEIGLNGTDGNSELFKIRFGGNAKRETEETILSFDWLYNYAKANGEDTENRAIFDGRQEWLFPETPFSWFITEQLIFDEFKAYDARLALHTGLGYEWINTKTTKLKSRIGAGGSWEFGGPDNAFMPEAVLGLDFEHKISDRQKITSKIDIFPELDDLGEFRAQAKIDYEILIDPDWNLTFKIGALDLYDSTPQGKRRNDVQYYLVLLWSF